MHYCRVDLLLGKLFVCQYWQVMSNNTTSTVYIVGKFGIGASFILILKNSCCSFIYVYIYCCIATFPNIYVLCNSVELFSVKATRVYHAHRVIDSCWQCEDWSFHCIYDVRWHYCQLCSFSLHWRKLGDFSWGRLQMFFQGIKHKSDFMQMFQCLLHFSSRH